MQLQDSCLICRWIEETLYTGKFSATLSYKKTFTEVRELNTTDDSVTNTKTYQSHESDELNQIVMFCTTVMHHV